MLDAVAVERAIGGRDGVVVRARRGAELEVVGRVVAARSTTPAATAVPGPLIPVIPAG
jgi:hypothetical protein